MSICTLMQLGIYGRNEKGGVFACLPAQMRAMTEERFHPSVKMSKATAFL
ncbi:hypothetical protein HYC85_010677 [Camellia sinensis]|uniref:Uncharacterized protein n=1 Tax=Camellia sinensis TaxID=4442 RepID=A0A7J7HIR0_CAMSI|nr:hypothetical protein HYC85_010677 [Camellia sinensis]